MQCKDYDGIPEGIIYRDSRAFLRLHFSDVMFSFAPRSCNKIAHAMAAYGASRQADKQLWLEALPNDAHVMVTSTFAKSGI
jgi:hypothetical protein